MDKQSNALLSVGVKLVAEGVPATYKTLQTECGQSLKSIRQIFRAWQRELGQRETNKPNIRALITDYAIFITWQKFLQVLDEEEKKMVTL